MARYKFLKRIQFHNFCVYFKILIAEALFVHESVIGLLKQKMIGILTSDR